MIFFLRFLFEDITEHKINSFKKVEKNNFKRKKTNAHENFELNQAKTLKKSHKKKALR